MFVSTLYPIPVEKTSAPGQFKQPPAQRWGVLAVRAFLQGKTARPPCFSDRKRVES